MALFTLTKHSGRFMRTHAVNQGKESIEHCMFKNVGDICAEIAHLVESSNRWLSLDDINIAERYLANDFNICFVLKPLAWFKDASLLKFGKWNAFVEPMHLVQVQDFHVVDLHEANGLNFPERPERDKKHMPVFVSDSVDGPEKVVSSFVWFEPFDDGPRIGGEFIYLSLCTGRREFLSVPSKRKMDTFRGGVFESSGCGGQIVERCGSRPTTTSRWRSARGSPTRSSQSTPTRCSSSPAVSP